MGYCTSSGSSQIPLIQVFFFWVSLVLMIVLLVLFNTNQTRPSFLNHISPFVVFFYSILLFFLSTFALVLRAFVWPSRAPLRKLGLTQSLFWYVIGVMGWAYVASVVQEEDTNSLVSFFLLAVLSIPLSNVILYTTTNLGLTDSLVGLCASAGYKIAKQKVVGFFVITFFVVGFAIAKFYSESYKSRYTRNDVDDIEKGHRENDACVKMKITVGYAIKNIIDGSINTSVHKAELLGANVDWGVIIGFDQIEERATTSSVYTIPLTENEVKELFDLFSNGTKNDHEASGSGT